MKPWRSLFVLLLSMTLALPSQAEQRQEKIRILLDTDANNELDDQHAIAYMLFNGSIFDVEGITVNATSGGGEIQKHVDEAVRIVTLCNLKDDVEVIAGASGKYDEIVPNIGKDNFDGHQAVNHIIKQAHKVDKRKLVLMPVGKLTNIALALKKDPSIAPKVRIVWLGSNYPDPGEYNFVHDLTAIDPIIESNVPFEMVMVRYGKPSGTDAVKASLKEIKKIMPGKGPSISQPVTGRHGGEFRTFGDYSVELFEKFRGNPTERPLFDMAAVAIVKNPKWAKRVEMGAPMFADGKWTDRPKNPRKIVIWEDFDRDGIMQDFYKCMDHYVLAK